MFNIKTSLIIKDNSMKRKIIEKSSMLIVTKYYI